MASFFPSLKQNFIAYYSSKVSSCPDCIFEIHQLWQSGFSRLYSNSCGSCWFKAEIIKIGQSSHKMYRNNIVNFQESTTILNACTKKVWKHWMHHVQYLLSYHAWVSNSSLQMWTTRLLAQVIVSIVMKICGGLATHFWWADNRWMRHYYATDSPNTTPQFLYFFP